MSRTRMRARSAALVALTAAVLVTAAQPALAHDELLRTAPADGSSVAAVPSLVVLTFAEPPADLGTAVAVAGPGGDATSGGPRLEGATLTQALRPGSPAGTYTVTWRVTADDGHPVSGTFSFTAAAPGSGTASSGQPTPSAPAAASDDGPHSAVPLVVTAGVVLLGLALAAVAFVLRRRDLRGDQ